MVLCCRLLLYLGLNTIKMAEIPVFNNEKELLQYLAENALFSLDYSCCYGQDETSFSLEKEGLKKHIEQQFPGFLDRLSGFVVYRCIHSNMEHYTQFFVNMGMEENQIAIIINPTIYGRCLEEFEPEGQDSLCKLIKPILPKINKVEGFENVDEYNFDERINFTTSSDEMFCEINIASEDEFANWIDYEEVDGADKIVTILEKYFIKKIQPSYEYSDQVTVKDNVVLFYPVSQVNGDEIKLTFSLDELWEKIADR
jgi:hypothetical protein